MLGQQITVTQPVLTLATYALLEGPASGTDSDIVVAGVSWSATSNAAWVHTTSSGTGNGLAIFSFDANSGATRSGTLTIGGLTLTVTQAGSGYVAANPVTLPFSYSEGLAVDETGNVYTTQGSPIVEWNTTTQTFSFLGSVSSVLEFPTGLAVDGVGNVYVADNANNTIMEWNATTETVTTLVSTGLNDPCGVAVDSSGNVYIADSESNAIEEWNATTQTLSTLVSSGLNEPCGVAVDWAGNVYIADTYNNAIKEWNATTQTVSTLVSSGLDHPFGVAVDEAGNVYIADFDNSAIKEWNAATQTASTLVSSGLDRPNGVAVDRAGNVYFTNSNVIEEQPRAFVPGGPVFEGAAAGSDQLLLPVLPTTEVLTGVFAPSNDQPWLAIGNVSGGVISFSFTQNIGVARTAHITVLGQQIAVTQWPPLPLLGPLPYSKARPAARIRSSSPPRVPGQARPTLPGCTRRPAAPTTAWPSSRLTPIAGPRGAAP